MPSVRVVFWRQDDGTVPMVEWLEGLQSQPKHRAKCIKWLTILRDYGHDLRRPIAAHLRDDVHEFRVQFSFENYRMLYFFYGGDRAVVTHGITKHTDKVPPDEIDKAISLKKRYENDPESHTYNWEP